MADFPTALACTLKFEGGFNQNTETGEVVNLGVTARFLASIGLPHSVDDVRALTVEAVTPLYEKYFWSLLCGSEIADQTLANHVFDAGVNQGVETCAKELQKAVNDTPSISSSVLVVDGVIGHRTILGVNACDPAALVKAFQLRAAARYRLVASENPALASDLEGWLDRLYSE